MKDRASKLMDAFASYFRSGSQQLCTRYEVGTGVKECMHGTCTIAIHKWEGKYEIFTMKIELLRIRAFHENFVPQKFGAIQYFQHLIRLYS